MVGADDALADIAAAVAVQHVAAMRAAVVEHAHRAIGMADHDHRLAADLHRPVVADVLHLAFVPDIGPHLVEDAFHLELENRRVGIDAAVNTIGLHRLGNIQADIGCHRVLLLLYATSIGAAPAPLSKFRHISWSAQRIKPTAGSGRRATALSLTRHTAGQMRANSRSPDAVKASRVTRASLVSLSRITQPARTMRSTTRESVVRSIDVRSASALIDRRCWLCSVARIRHSGARRPSALSAAASWRSRRSSTWVNQKKRCCSRTKAGTRSASPVLDGRRSRLATGSARRGMLALPARARSSQPLCADAINSSQRAAALRQ